MTKLPGKTISITAQPTLASSQRREVNESRPQPVAPPVYRPQPVPRVLQRKTIRGQQPHAGQRPRQPVAPPVYRPVAKKIVQPKMVATQTHKPPKAPPVYRPEQRQILQPKIMSRPRTLTTPPVYRPQTKILQPMMVAAQAHMPPAPPPIYRPGSSAIQRKVIEKIVSGKKIYYSDKDPASKFNTREAAELHDLTCNLPRVDEGTRGPTLYTYTHTKWNCQISPRGIPQGPHTMGHAAASSAFSDFGNKQNILHTFAEQVPSPDEWYQMVINEKGKFAFNGKDKVSKGLIRAYEDYSNLYKATTLLIEKGEHDKARYNIGLLMQMSPYSTYCWKSPVNASQKSLKYKGEGHDITDEANIDKGGKWAKPGVFQDFIEDRGLLLDEDFEGGSSSSSSSDDSSSSSDDSSNSSDEDMKVAEEITLNQVNYLGAVYYFSPDEIDGHGDCLFDTLIAVGVVGRNSVQQLRNIAAANGGQANIATPLVWANAQDITALANHFGIRIRVLVIAVHGNGVLQVNTYGAGGPKHIVGHIYGGHYTPLRRGWN